MPCPATDWRDIDSNAGLLELLLMAYAIWAAWLAWHIQPEICLYLLIYALSFASVAAWGLREHRLVRRIRLLASDDTTGTEVNLLHHS